MDRIKMTRVVNGVRFDTEKATLIAHDVFWDGHNFERSGRNSWLYRTAKGRYFQVDGTFWQGESDSLEPLSEDEARHAFERELSEHCVKYEEAFPDVKVEEA